MAKRDSRSAPSGQGRHGGRRRAASTAWPERREFRRWSPQDDRLFAQGRHVRLHHRLGAHPSRQGDREGVTFSVWAPSAARVAVIGSFNRWDAGAHPLQRIGRCGVWTRFVPGVPRGALYKFHIESALGDHVVAKADPFAVYAETSPATASRVWTLDHAWGDGDWLARRRHADWHRQPVSIYEVHLGSWRRPDDDPEGFLGYRELAQPLADYASEHGFTHVELLPPLEHPFYGSWGYQITGYFAATSRYGTPQDLMYLIDTLHRRGIGVVLDWVPSHFPGDEHGLGFFDGTRLFEYPDPRVGYQPDWKSYVFNYGRPEVRAFLISSALFWIEHFHIDALRVDAVASMLYLDYSRPEGQWIRNRLGGRENLEAIAFLRRLNAEVHRLAPGVQTVAEESTAWPLVSAPEAVGGLGFDAKWDMGWMHDTLDYAQNDPIHRKFHHNKITFRAMYAFSERFVLPLSHDEVVHGKGSLLGKMWGDVWQRFANLRLFLGYMWTQPGKKLLFMGGELGQWREWSHERQLDWQLLQYPSHAGLQRWVGDLNRTYRDLDALHQQDFDGRGFRWIDCNDADQSVVCYSRHARDHDDCLVVVCNFTPVPRHHYRVGVPFDGPWLEVLNSDAEIYGGSGVGNQGQAQATPMRYHGRPFSLSLTLPPLGLLVLRHSGPAATEPAP